MKLISIVTAVAGVAVAALLVAWFGVGAVLHAISEVGMVGFAAICALHLGLIIPLGIAWKALLPDVAVPRAVWARLVRDSVAEALPLSQVGGYVVGARALSLTGVPWSVAAASTIVDVTLEFFAQLPYTALGLALFVWLQPDTQVALPMLVGLMVAAVAAASFTAVQHRGFRYLDRISGILGAGWAERGGAGAAVLHSQLTGIYRHRSGVLLSFVLHFACWVASAVQLWVLLWLAGTPLPFAAVLAIESLVYATRTAGFVVPQAVGLQEGAYIVFGAGFGVSPEMALAVSLLKRGRDLATGLPVVAIWQMIEARRLLRRRAAVPSD
jgi:glycosyltransferase 2 family protein